MIDNLPHSKETEEHLLGIVFQDDATFSEIAHLEPKDFYNPVTRNAYEAMHELVSEGQPINPVTVMNKMSVPVAVSEIVRWFSGLPVLMQAEPLIAILRDKRAKREVIHKAHKLLRKASDDIASGDEIVSEALDSFQEVKGNVSHKPTVSLFESTPSSIERWDKMLSKEIVTIQTGLPDVDRELTGGGLEKGMFHVIGARPSAGKTSMGLDILAHNCLDGKVGVFFTLELSEKVLIDRLLSPLAGVERYKITSQYINEHDKKRLVAVAEALKGIPLYVNAKARTVQEMRIALRDVQRKAGKVDLVIVDFIQRMARGKGSAYEAVTNNTIELADLASEYECVVLALSQFSRESTKKDRPELTDFRDSGAIEELGRTIFALWGEESSRVVRPVNFACLKQGEGRLFELPLAFNVDFMTFGPRRCLIQSQ